uniref:Uncharacterized protein n=1 Tax=Mycena chlorophos TaxID=658473 RepID=A0ABQ0KV77_MYCCL|nr:predicted protein [Mycena chlorophos]
MISNSRGPSPYPPGDLPALLCVPHFISDPLFSTTSIVSASDWSSASFMRRRSIATQADPRRACVQAYAYAGSVCGALRFQFKHGRVVSVSTSVQASSKKTAGPGASRKSAQAAGERGRCAGQGREGADGARKGWTRDGGTAA